MDSIYDVVQLLLTLTASLLCGLHAEAFLVGTAPNVRAWKGADIRLRCDIQGEPRAVYWNQGNILDQQLRVTKATFVNGMFESRDERFVMERDFSLVITDLQVADEGRYYCRVALTDQNTSENSTLLTIGSMASRHTIEECVHTSQSHQSRCTLQTLSNTHSLNFTCVVSGFKPNISMLWTEESGKRLNSVVSQQIVLSDNTFERSETITISVKHGKEQTFFCTATGYSLNGTSTEEITLSPLSEKRDNLGVSIGLIIGVPVAVFIIFLLVGKCLQKYRPDSIPRKGCGWIPCWRRIQRPKRIDEEEELTLRSAPMSPSLAKEQLAQQQCIEDLKEYYHASRRKVTLDPLNFMERANLDEIYTNLRLIDQSDISKTPLTYEDLLVNDISGKLSKRVLIQGEGGVGKTTLCSKIAWDWCQGRILQDMDMVIVIPLRYVTDGKSLGGIVKRYLSDSNAATPEQIDDYISKNVSKILLVFDGFDEFNGKIEKQSSSEVIRILGFEQYKSARVIVTTRPWRRHEFSMAKNLAEAYTFVSVEGFSKENLATYIKKYFRMRRAVSESLISFMEENDIIRSNMAPFPIYCAMLCLMWSDYSEERRKEMTKMQTFSELFGEILSFLKRHYASKVCEYFESHEVLEHLKEADGAIQDISEIALNGLFNINLSFPEEQFNECHDAMETCCRVGVLTIEREVITGKRRRDANVPSLVASIVSFPHKLFQDYVAGFCIGYMYANNLAKYEKIRQKLVHRREEFRYLLYFASALWKELGHDILTDIIEDVYSYRHYSDKDKIDVRDFCVDVAFECHTEEAARAVGEQWEDYKLTTRASQHTNAGVVFMVHSDQALISSIERANMVSWSGDLRSRMQYLPPKGISKVGSERI